MDSRPGLPEWLRGLIGRVESTGRVERAIDHALVNEYKPGEGIMPHTDGPTYVPCVACVSIGGRCDMVFQRRLGAEEERRGDEDGLGRVELKPRSLVVFYGAAYHEALHSIENVECEDAYKTRISLTLRKILI